MSLDWDSAKFYAILEVIYRKCFEALPGLGSRSKGTASS